jgi:hypothetical protein
LNGFNELNKLGAIMRVLILALALILSATPLAVGPSDPILELQARMKSGAVKLASEPKHGYLESLLKNLDIPVSSQTLVFSKTSFQTERISPKNPRAMYFNDDVYVAWIPGSLLIEIMSLGSPATAGFYLLNQDTSEPPEFERSTGHDCSVCHYVHEAAPRFVPHFMVSSVVPDMEGNAEGAFPIETTDRSPMNERWGGWYVTGTHGNQKHLGNTVLQKPASAFAQIPPAAFSKSFNVTDLKSRFDTSRYLSPHSDIVALMVLEHQTDVQNLMVLAAQPAASPKETGEHLLQAMLFSGAAPLTAPVQGASNFAAEFSARGPRDSGGRALRDFDLKTRLFRYPLSYLIYSKAFDGLPQPVKTYVYQRLREVLTGADKSPAFAHLSATDRKAILEILTATKPDFRG